MTPGVSPEPPPASGDHAEPRVAQPRSSGPRWAAAIVTPLVVLLSALGLDAVDQAAPEVLGGVAQRYVPPDGHRTILEDAAGAIVVAEHSRSIGIEGLLTAPPLIAESLLDRLGDDSARTAQWWRITRTASTGDRTTDLYRLSAEGITQVASWGGAVGFVFEPELVLVPADARPGDEWGASGSALANGALVYEARAEAFAATGPFTDVGGEAVPLTGGCLGVDLTIRIASTVDDLATTLAEQTVWCPGRGAVWSVGSIDGQPVGQAEIRPASLAEVVAVGLGEGGVTVGSGWTDAASSATGLAPLRRETLVSVDPFFGESETVGQFGVPPVALSDGRFVTANDRGDDLQWWRPDGGRAVLDAVGHPGGTIIAIAALGEGAVATTAQRAVVAYDALGRRLWQWRGGELVLVPPLVVPDPAGDRVLVVDRSGDVVLLDGATGTERWSTGLSADARTHVVLAEGAAIIGDERGRVTALAVDDGRVLWRVDLGLVEHIAASPDGTTVAVMLDSGSLGVLDASDGSSRWSVRLPGFALGLLVDDVSVIALTDELLASFALSDGGEQWRASGAEAIAGGGGLILAVDTDAVRLLAGTDGTLLDQRAVAPVNLGASRTVVLVGSDVLLIDTDGVVHRGGLR